MSFSYFCERDTRTRSLKLVLYNLFIFSTSFSFLQDMASNQTAVTVNVFYAIVIPLTSLVATTLNIATIYAFWKLPKLRHKPSEVLILNLSCADLLTGIIVLPLASPLYITPGAWPFGEVGCQMAILFLNIGIPTSLFALISISMDRFLLVYMEYPKYVRIQSKFRIYITIAACWAAALLSVFIELGVWNYAEDDIKDQLVIDYTKLCLSPARRLKSFFLTYFLVLYFIPILAVCSLSIAFLYFLHKRLVNSKRRSTEAMKTVRDSTEISSVSSTPSGSQQQLKPPQKKSPSHVLRKRYIRPAATLVSLVLAMAICMLPYSFYVLVMDFFCTHCPLNTDIIYALLLLQFFNAFLNPLLYAITHRRIRKFHKACLRTVFTRLQTLRCCKADESNA